MPAPSATDNLVLAYCYGEMLDTVRQHMVDHGLIDADAEYDPFKMVEVLVKFTAKALPPPGDGAREREPKSKS